MKALSLVAVGFCAVAALAQFPGTGGGPLGGGSPFPGGSPIPGGRRPTQQQTPQDQGKAQSKDSRNSKNAPVAGTTTEGKVRRAVTGQLVIEGDDHRVIWYRLNSRTVLQKEGQDAAIAAFVPGDHVTVDSTEDDQGFFTAVEVRWETAGTAEDRATAREIWDLPTTASAAPASSSGAAPAARRGSDDDERPVLRRKNADGTNVAPAEQSPEPTPAPAASSKKNAPAPAPAADEEPVDNRPATEIRQAGDPAPDADDPGRPKLKRGAPPAARPATAPAPAQTATAPAPATAPAAPPAQRSAATPPTPQTRASAPILPQEDPLILKAREVAASYSDSLPNFFAQQMTTRYQSTNPRQGWDALDIVTADVAYQDGKETYKNIKVGNKPVSKSMEDIGGTRSTGEFSSQMEAILRSGAGVTFKRDGEDRIRNRTAIVFKFDIPRERSGWRIEDVSQLYYPAYRGSIWIDKETSRVLRIEQEARNVPRLFPLDTIETSTDYDFVRLSVGNDFLLPVEAEVLSCQRGTSACSRNKIEFRNYRKFGADSEITFGDPASK